MPKSSRCVSGRRKTSTAGSAFRGRGEPVKRCTDRSCWGREGRLRDAVEPDEYTERAFLARALHNLIQTCRTGYLSCLFCPVRGLKTFVKDCPMLQQRWVFSSAHWPVQDPFEQRPQHARHMSLQAIRIRPSISAIATLLNKTSTASARHAWFCFRREADISLPLSVGSIPPCLLAADVRRHRTTTPGEA